MKEITLSNVAFQLDNLRNEMEVINSMAFVLMLASSVDAVVRDFYGALSVLNDATIKLLYEIAELNEKISDSIKSDEDKKAE